MVKQTERYIPTGYEKRYEDENCVVYVETRPLGFVAMGFHGRAVRPDFHFSYKKAESVDEKIVEYAAGWKRHAEFKAEQKVANKGKTSSHAAAAAAIRAELKALFPKTIFRVHSSSFSMGDDVNVRWIDGPLQKTVEAIIRKYQYGYFDGRTDCYEYSNRRRDIPQAKYVFAERSLSVERAQDLASKYEAKNGRKIVIDSRGAYWSASWATKEDEIAMNHASARGELFRIEEEEIREEAVRTSNAVRATLSIVA